MNREMIVLFFMVLLRGLFAGSTTFAAPVGYKVDLSTATFAIVTHKAGLGKALAHDHFIAVKDLNPTSVALSVDETNLDQSLMNIEFSVEQLLVDDFDAAKKIFEDVKALDIKKDEFTKLEEKDRQKIRETMLSEEQLDAKKHPKISGKIMKIRSQVGKIGTVTTTHVVSLELKIHGVSHTFDMPVNISLSNGQLNVLATAKAKFTDFQIKPFSLFMVVKNEDQFDVLIKFSATKS